ncbi:MAG TPA: carbamoyltransferase HypF [Anaerolineaceae bacterium]|nr:carbamoyltransferase HypF [Anaerolineaceae bacterium]
MTGIVQGVGFRPTVYAYAAKHHLGGWVLNSSHGVEIEVSGSPETISAFIEDLQTMPPSHAVIESFDVSDLPDFAYSNFEIRESTDQSSDFMPVPSDMAICPECTHELFDPANRRYRYPFINCTHCGPRYSIVQAIPYDRPNTTMSAFSLCPDCAREYHDPADRRFHAQPIACPVCGPKTWFQIGNEAIWEGTTAIFQARDFIKAGKIVAVKGLGGFHLFCDATNPQAVERLRERKHRSGKPLAVMGFNLAAVSRYVSLSNGETELLLSPPAPIVLVDPNESGRIILKSVAPDQNRLGVMLAYTPLHLLLLEPADDFPDLVVATSGNLSEEPICYTQEDAISKLSSIADGFLMHDRPIHHAIDDSLTQILKMEIFQEYPIRRARGSNTRPLKVSDGPQILGTGAELKSTFCLARQGRAFLSQHLGDLQNQETQQAYERAVAHDQSLYRIQPELVSCDLHPDYLSTRFAQDFAIERDLPLIQVQHHHAHMAACILENGLDPKEPVFALTFDGTGYGTDGTLWGGEILTGNCLGFERSFHLKQVPQPGGDQAVREPARMALAYLLSAGLPPDTLNLPLIGFLGWERVQVISAQIRKSINAPLTSSMGRLFDAVSSLLGLYHSVSYEAQGAVALETLADPSCKDFYPLELEGQIIDQVSLFPHIMADLEKGLPRQIISAKFHNAIAQISIQCLLALRKQQGINKVVISGGVWQNLYLLKRTYALLKEADFEVYTHSQVPANDACVSLGQVAVALAQSER